MFYGVVANTANRAQHLESACVSFSPLHSMKRCTSLLETMLRFGQDATLQLLWLYERYSVPNAGGGLTKCRADHFGRDMGAFSYFGRFSAFVSERHQIVI